MPDKGNFQAVVEPTVIASGQANAEVTVGHTGTLQCLHEAPIVLDRAAFNQGTNAQHEPYIEQAELKPSLVARGPHAVATPAVRRLTPTECERLMGFPDNWTAIPWRGKEPADCPDSHRYKACGNSMAVPVIRWIGERIDAVMNGTRFVHGIPESFRAEIEGRNG